MQQRKTHGVNLNSGPNLIKCLTSDKSLKLIEALSLDFLIWKRAPVNSYHAQGHKYKDALQSGLHNKREGI